MRSLNILIAEDDRTFRDILSKILVGAKHKVQTAENGLVAQDIFDSCSDIDLVIADVQMPELTGDKLLSHIRGKSNVPVILMSGGNPRESGVFEGANCFIKKPFRIGEILDAVKLCANTEKNRA